MPCYQYKKVCHDLQERKTGPIGGARHPLTITVTSLDKGGIMKQASNLMRVDTGANTISDRVITIVHRPLHIGSSWPFSWTRLLNSGVA